jgi:ribosomal protein L37E
MRTPEETRFQNAVLTVAQLCGWRAYHTHDSRRSAAGFPDLVLVRPPRVIFAELKTRTGRASPAQLDWLQLLRDCPGVETYLWRPADWDTGEIVRRLKETP